MRRGEEGEGGLGSRQVRADSQVGFRVKNLACTCERVSDAISTDRNCKLFVRAWLISHRDGGNQPMSCSECTLTVVAWDKSTDANERRLYV